MAHGPPGGLLAVTTWGPRVLEPGTSIWWDAVREVRSDLVNPVSPWDRIVEPQALRGLLRGAGIAEAEIAAEGGRQRLNSPEDWWTIVLGSGFRWTVEQLGQDAAERVRSITLAQMRRRNVREVGTNAMFATACKSA